MFVQLRPDRAWVPGVVSARREGGRSYDALDQVPELDESTVALTLMYGYLSIDGIRSLIYERGDRAPAATVISA